MRILLDTHVALWVLLQASALTKSAREMLYSADSVYFSVISVWEVCLKHEINPQNMAVPAGRFRQLCLDAGFVELPIESKHVLAVEDLKQKEGSHIHKDPFDRLLLAQAKAEELLFMTHDKKIQTFDTANIIAI